MNRKGYEKDQFFKSCQQGQIKVVQEILAKYSLKAEELVNSYSSDHKTPLYYAINSNSFPVVRLLIKYGADVNKPSSVFYGKDCSSPSFETCEEPPVVTAARVASIELLRCLLRNGADVNQQTEVMSSHCNNYTENVNLALNSDRKNNRRRNKAKIFSDETLNFPIENILYRSFENENEGITRSRPSSQCSYYGMSAVHSASEFSKVDVVKLLISFGANVEAEEGKRLEKPLHLAVRCQSALCDEQCKVVDLLCSAGADTNSLNKKKQSPLYIASLYGCAKKVEILFRHGAYPNPGESVAGQLNFQSDWGGYGSAIHIAAYKDYLPLAIVLINNGANINCKNQNGVTPLQLNVAVRNKSHISALLIFHGALLNVQSDYHKTNSLINSRGLITLDLPNTANSNMSNSLSNEDPKQNLSNSVSLLAACILKPRLDCESLAILLVQAGYNLNQDPWLALYNYEDHLMAAPSVVSPAEWRVSRLCRWLRAKQQTVRTLTELSRAAIRYHLAISNNGKSIVSSVNKLPLPIGLKNFLLLKNLSGINIEPAIFKCLNELQ